MSPAPAIRPPEVSPLERFILDRICRPLLSHIPESVTPNMISWSGHLAAWTAFILAASSSFVEREMGLWVLLLAGFAMLAQMVLDNLDGMHARATNQCSKFGEFLDHWLDAIHVPLTSAAIAMCLVLHPLLLVAVQLTAALIYNAQLVTYRKFGSFVHPPTSGTVAQFYLAIAFAVLGPYFYFMPRDAGLNPQLILGISLLAVVMHIRQAWYYWRHLRSGVIEQLPFFVLAAGFGALYIGEHIGWMEYVLFSVFLSFRITGSCVLHTVLKRERYDVMDFGVLFAQGLLYFAATRWVDVQVGGVALTQLVVYCTLLYMVGRNVLELVRVYPEFRVGVAESRTSVRVE